MTEHTVRAFGEELTHLTGEVARMGGLVEAQINDALAVVVRRELTLADQVVARDRELDTMQADLERKVIRLIALRQPMAQDLRQAVACMKIAGDLERCGDLAKNIAKRGVVLAQSDPATPLTRSIERMGTLVASRLKQVLDGYALADDERAVAVWSKDDEIDAHYDSLFRELLTYMMGDPRTIQAGAHLLFIAKNLERIGDHATNIAEIVHYQITGEELALERPKLDALRQGGDPAP
ncbi:MAG: phosphate signaling complex protein PhoU [Caulobacteraceae bacterium]